MDTSTRCDMACDILRKTNDGDTLDPKDLSLLEGAVNGNLSEYGYQVFSDLHDRVMNDKYARPWFHGVTHLTIDHEGYVYYKGQHVEHYTLSWAYSKEAKEQAVELGRRCELLEAHGHTVNCANAIFAWKALELSPITPA